jgi:hypothetical protein
MADLREVADLELYAWVGWDEFQSGEIGLKQSVVPAGIIPMVAIRLDKMEKHWDQAEAQARKYGKRIFLVRFQAVEIVRETKDWRNRMKPRFIGVSADTMFSDEGLSIAVMYLNPKEGDVTMGWLPSLFVLPMPDVVRDMIVAKLRQHADKIESGEMQRDIGKYVNTKEGHA